MSSSITLSTIKPDFESILLQLQLAVQDNSTWIDLQTSGTGETLLELYSAVCCMLQFGIESAAREAFLTTAVRASSIYAGTRNLGVRIHRKTPAYVPVQISRAQTKTSEVIPKFTQFGINNSNYFNRNSLMFAKGSSLAAERVYYGNISFDGTRVEIDTAKIGLTSIYDGQPFKLQIETGGGAGTTVAVTYDSTYKAFNPADLTGLSQINSKTVAALFDEQVYLYQGTITTETFTSDAVAFKQLTLTPTAFKVADIDVFVTVTNPSTGEISEWTTLDDGIWTASSTDKVYYDSTSGYGEALISFGDGYHGMVPQLGSTITVTYAVTDGSSATGVAGLAVTCDAYPYTGKTTGVIAGGADERPSSYYKAIAPQIFKARKRAVSQDDYQAIAGDFPGVISVSIMGQRDIAPNDLRWMNVVQICLLPIDTSVTVVTNKQWNDFLTYMSKKKHAAVHLVKKDATEMKARVELTLALKANYKASDTMPVAEAAVLALFSRQATTLGRRISESDIVRAASVTGVDYVQVSICTTGTTDAVEELIPVDSTYFVSLAEDALTINTKYSERSVYYGGSST